MLSILQKLTGFSYLKVKDKFGQKANNSRKEKNTEIKKVSTIKRISDAEKKHYLGTN